MEHEDTSEVRDARAFFEAQRDIMKRQLLDELRAEQRKNHRGLRARMIAAGAVLALAGGAVTAVAQTVADDLRVFGAGQPALASDVNFNFALLKQWIEHKVGNAKSPIVTHTKAVQHTCVNCGSPSAVDGTESWGTLVQQGRVISTNSNLHLSPPGGFNVVIDDTYRAAGGSSAGAAGLTVEGVISSQGKTLASHIRDYVRTSCHLAFGWADGCDGGCDGAPAKYGSIRADGTCEGVVGADSECSNNWVGINVDGEVDGNDKFFVRLICD
jgi:hypothetical protein